MHFGVQPAGYNVYNCKGQVGTVATRSSTKLSNTLFLGFFVQLGDGTSRWPF